MQRMRAKSMSHAGIANAASCRSEHSSCLTIIFLSVLRLSRVDVGVALGWRYPKKRARATPKTLHQLDADSQSA